MRIFHTSKPNTRLTNKKFRLLIMISLFLNHSGNEKYQQIIFYHLDIVMYKTKTLTKILPEQSFRILAIQDKNEIVISIDLKHRDKTTF